MVLEYNGMWQLQQLFQNLPDDWAVYQEMFFADATTFLQYNANMRSLVVDKLNTCELVVFNRFGRTWTKWNFTRSSAVSAAGQILPMSMQTDMWNTTRSRSAAL